MQFLWLSHFKGGLDLLNNELTGTLTTEMGNMNELSKLLCTHCLNSLLDFIFSTIICKSLLWIYDLKLESVNLLISHRLQFFWISHFKVWLDLSNNELTGTLPTEIGNMNQLRKLLCTHCLNSLMNFVLCMINCIYWLWICDLDMESVSWPKYLTTCSSCDFLVSKSRWICGITN